MPTTHDRVFTLCREIAARLRAVAANEGEDLTPAERRDLVEVGAVGLARRVYAAEIARAERKVRTLRGGNAVVDAADRSI